jgi:hypothetical protein
MLATHSDRRVQNGTSVGVEHRFVKMAESHPSEPASACSSRSRRVSVEEAAPAPQPPTDRIKVLPAHSAHEAAAPPPTVEDPPAPSPADVASPLPHELRRDRNMTTLSTGRSQCDEQGPPASHLRVWLPLPDEWKVGEGSPRPSQPPRTDPPAQLPPRQPTSSQTQQPLSSHDPVHPAAFPLS